MTIRAVPRLLTRSADVEAACEVRAANIANELRIAAHHDLIPGPRQADVEPFAGAFEGGLLVDDEHHRTTLKTFEAEHVTVEDLIGVPEAVPVGGVAGGLAFLLLRMPRAGGQQRYILR